MDQVNKFFMIRSRSNVQRADYYVNKSWNVRFWESFSYLFSTLTRSAVKEVNSTQFAGIVRDLRYRERLESADNERGEKAG